MTLLYKLNATIGFVVLLGLLHHLLLILQTLLGIILDATIYYFSHEDSSKEMRFLGPVPSVGLRPIGMNVPFRRPTCVRVSSDERKVIIDLLNYVVK